jgi:hypothetical protein
VSVVSWVLAGAAGVLFVWGAVSPRGFWTALIVPLRSDPRGTEPSRPAFAASRFLALLGAISVGVVLVGWIADARLAARTSVAEAVWSAPAPVVVDRVVVPVAGPPEGLTAVPVTGYQVVDPATVASSYLAETPVVRDTGVAAEPGFLGTAPAEGVAAITTADLVVRVVGDTRCIPQQVAVVESADRVQVGVFFGALPAEGATAPAPCVLDPAADPGTTSETAYLVPLDLGAPVGARAVQDLAGTAVPAVPGPAD